MCLERERDKQRDLGLGIQKEKNTFEDRDLQRERLGFMGLERDIEIQAQGLERENDIWGYGF